MQLIQFDSHRSAPGSMQPIAAPFPLKPRLAQSKGAILLNIPCRHDNARDRTTANLPSAPLAHRAHSSDTRQANAHWRGPCTGHLRLEALCLDLQPIYCIHPIAFTRKRAILPRSTSPAPTTSSTTAAQRSSQGGEDVRITGVEDRKARSAEHLTARGTKGVVVAREVVHGALGKHRKVLQLRLADGRAVLGDHEELALALHNEINVMHTGTWVRSRILGLLRMLVLRHYTGSIAQILHSGRAVSPKTHGAQGLHRGLVSHVDDTFALEHELQAGVDGIGGLLLRYQVVGGRFFTYCDDQRIAVSTPSS